VETKKGRKAQHNTPQSDINPSPSPSWAEKLGKPILHAVREALDPEDLEAIRQLALREDCLQYQLIRQLIVLGISQAKPRLEIILKKEASERGSEDAKFERMMQLGQEEGT